MTIELIQRTKTHYFFVISILNYYDGEKKLTYIFFKRTIEYINDLIRDCEYGEQRTNYEHKNLID